MDRPQFDRWERPFGMAPSRRVLLGGVAGVALGGLFGAHGDVLRAAASTHTAQPKQKRLAKMAVLTAGLKWLESKQDKDGAFPYEGSDPDIATTATIVSTMVALRNVGLDVDLDAAVAYLKKNIPAKLADDVNYGEVAQTVMVLVAAGNRADVSDEVITWLSGPWTKGTSFSGSDGLLRLIAFGMMAVAAAGKSVDQQAIDLLVSRQVADGSWNSQGDNGVETGDAITTGLIILTQIATGLPNDGSIANATVYLRTRQVDGGAISLYPDAPPDAYSTGTVISALIALGVNPKAKPWGKAVSDLIAFQNESGGFRYTDETAKDDVTTTAWALTALAGASWPVLPAS